MGASHTHARSPFLLKSEGVDVPYEIPVSFRDEGRVHDFVTTHLRAMLKAPWSGSGKGLCRTYGTYDLAVGRWVQGVLRRQGEVVCEPYFEKEADMAMEFLSDGNRVVFRATLGFRPMSAEHIKGIVYYLTMKSRNMYLPISLSMICIGYASVWSDFSPTI